MKTYLFSLSLLLAAVAIGGCSHTAEMTSNTPARPITIDASADEWRSALTSIEDKDGTSMGVRNDAQDLYLTLVTTNEDLIRQIVMRGLTVWFDAEGGKERRLGIAFPVGLRPDWQPRSDKRPASRSRPSQRRGGERGRLRELPAPRTDQLALRYGPDELGERHPVDSVAGVQAAASLENHTFTYELRVSLQSGDGFALDVTPGTEIGLGLETPEIERPDRQERGPGSSGSVGRGGGPPGGMGGRRPGGRRGNRRPGGDQDRPAPPEALSQWTRVTLVGN